MKKDEITINGRRYALIEGFGSNDPCEHCALKKECFDAEYYYCKNFVSHKTPLEDVTDTVTEEQVYDYYQERSKTSGERGDMLAWALVGMLCAQVIGDHAYLEFYVGGACGIMYMLLSMLQAVWQTVTAWIFKNIIHRTGDTPEDYPEWVGGGAWAFYWLKMTMLTIGTIYVAYRFASPLFDL